MDDRVKTDNQKEDLDSTIEYAEEELDTNIEYAEEENNAVQYSKSGRCIKKEEPTDYNDIWSNFIKRNGTG